MIAILTHSWTYQIVSLSYTMYILRTVCILNTGGDMLIIMTREFDVLLETSVQRAGFGEGNF